MVAVNVVTFCFLILVVSHDSEGESPGGFGHSSMWWGVRGAVLYLPAEGPPGAWSGDGFRLRDLNTVTIGDLPARFDWSIMGCTILLLAFMNLREMKRSRKKTDGKRGEDRKERGQKTQKNQSVNFSKQDQEKMLTNTMKILAHSTKTSTLPNQPLSLS